MTAGCVEPLPQSASVDVMTFIGVEAAVTRATLPTPLEVDGRARSEVLPGDTVRLRAVFADATRLYPPTVDDPELELAWYVCSTSDCGQPGVSPPPCPQPLPLANEQEACLLGQRGEVELQLAEPLAPLLERAGQLEILVLARRVESPDARSCFQRFIDPEPGEDLFDCAIGGRLVPFGPVGALIEAAEDEGLELDIDPSLLPTGLLTQDPNTSPAPIFTLTETRPSGEERSRLLTPGERVEVAPESDVLLSASVDPALDRQEYWGLESVDPFLEELSVSWYLVHAGGDAPAVRYTSDEQSFAARWRAPAGPGDPLVLVAQLSDIRFSETITWFSVDLLEP